MSAGSIHTASAGSRRWLKIVGPGTLRIGPSFLTFLDQFSAENPEALVVDLAECDWIDSTFAGCLIGFSQRARQGQRPPLHLNRPSGKCLESLCQMHIDRLLHIKNTPLPPGLHWTRLEPAETAGPDLARTVIQAHEDLGASSPENRQFSRIAKALRADNDGGETSQS